MRRGPWRRWRLPLLVLLIGGIVLAGEVVVLHESGNHDPTNTFPKSSRPPTASVVIEGYDFLPSYTTSNLSDTNYIHPPECENCPQNFTPGTAWSLPMNLTNFDTGRGHNVTAINVTAPFQITVISPPLPYYLAPGAERQFILQVDLPSTPGYYFLQGYIAVD